MLTDGNSTFMSNPGCVVARSFPSQWPLASTTTRSSMAEYDLVYVGAAPRDVPPIARLNYLRAGASDMFPGSLSRRISCLQTLPGRGLPHDLGPAQSAMKCSLPSRVGHRCGVQREHDDNVRFADRWIFLAELFVVLIGLRASRRALIFPCRLLTLQANIEEEIAWCSGGTATPRRLAL